MKKSLLIASALFMLNTILPAQNFWQHVNSAFLTFSFGMTDNGDVFAFASDSMLYKSTTNGTSGSWTQMTGFPPVNSYNMYAAGNNVYLANNTMNYDGRGIYVSTNGGVTWNQRNSGLGADTTVIYVFSLANGYLLSLTRNATGAYKLFRSSDEGNSWSLSQVISEYVHSICVVSATEIYLVGINSLFKSINNGSTWTNLNATIPGNGIGNIIHRPTGDLIATGYGEIMKSTDSGLTWNYMTPTGLPSVASGRGAFIISPGDTLYLATDTTNGIFYSADWGNTWTTTGVSINTSTNATPDGEMMISKRGYLFCSPYWQGIYRSINPVTASQIVSNEVPVSEPELSVYPNPSNGKFKIHVTSPNSSALQLEVFNAFGQRECTYEYPSSQVFDVEIDLEKYATGFYFLRGKVGECEWVTKLVMVKN